MHSDFDLTELVALRDAIRLLPRRNGKHRHISVLYRWRARGIGGKRLWTTKVGGIVYTHPAALREFASSSEPALPPSEPKLSPRRVERTSAILERVRGKREHSAKPQV